MHNQIHKPLIINQDADIVKIKTERNSLGLLKTMIVVGFIFMQLILFLLVYLYFFSFFKWLTLASFVLSLVLCIYVLSTDKNSQSKPIWVMFLIACSSFGFIVYFISSPRVFWYRQNKRYKKILEKSNKYVKNNKISHTNKQIKSECEYFKRAGNFDAFQNSNIEYFPSGASFFDSVLESIEKAEKFIFIEYYIISNGVLLNRFLSILEEKVKQGVDVRIIYDDFGCHGTFKRKNKKQIKDLGIKLKSFNKLLPKFTILYNYRDHRKIVVVDGKVAFTGGANLADEYINEKRSHGYWKDACIKVEGEGVDGLTTIFLRNWEFVSHEEEDYQKYLGLYDKLQNDNIVVPYADGLEYENNIGKNAYTSLIANATEKLYIMSPYFVIDDTINNLLINKARAGVDVRIVLPEIADKTFVYMISRNTAEKLLAHGVKVYTMKNSFVHSKVVLNETSAIVSTINMDLRSFYQQFECGLYFTEQKVLKQVENDFSDTFTKSTEITDKNMKRRKLHFRLLSGITNLIAPFM